MRRAFILALVLAFFVSMLVIVPVWSLPFDVGPPKCYFCCDVNYDGQVDMKDVFIVVRSYGSTEGTPNWNPRADVNLDGKINVFDVVLVIRSFGANV